MCSGSARYLMMLGIEVLMKKHDICRILDCHNSPGELELAMASWDQKLTGLARLELAMASKLLAMASRQLAMASLTTHHMLSIRLVASKGYLRLVLAVIY